MSTLLSNSSNSLLKVCSKLSIRNYMKYLDLNVNSKNCELKSESCFPYMLNSYLFSSLKQNILYISKRYNENFGKDNYSPELENAINEQIKAELDAGYTYLNIATYFGRSIVALPGLHGFFMKMFYEELEHGLAFTKYQNLRGGLVKFSPLQPVDCDWSDIPSTFKTALNMEKDVKKKIIKVFDVSDKSKDIGAQDFLEEFIGVQDKSINEMARYYARASLLAKSEVGKYLFDRELYETHIKKDPAKCTAEIGPKLYS